MRFHRVIILKAVASRGGFDTCGLPLENRDKSRKKLNVLFLLNRLLE